MKKMLLIAVGVMLSTVFIGCSATSEVKPIGSVRNDICSNLSPTTQKLATIIINAKVSAYPDDGLCDPDVLSKEINKQLQKLEGDGDVQNKSNGLGYKAGSGYGSMDQPSAVALLLRDHETMDCSTSRVSHRSRIDSENRSFVYASRVIRNKSRRSHSRLHLYKFMRSVHQETS